MFHFASDGSAARWGYFRPGRSRIGGTVAETNVAETNVAETNVIAFPQRGRSTRPSAGDRRPSAAEHYEFNTDELNGLCRWFSAMKYAFPGAEGIVIVSHQERYSAVGLYSRAGGAPNCLIVKQEVGGAVRYFWSTEGDSPKVIGQLIEITDAHIRAIKPPRDEKGWLDPMGWRGVYAARMITPAVQVV